MKKDVFKTCLDKVPSEVDIHFSGFGEPWLNPDCTDMLLYAFQKGHRIKASTTLEGMTSSDVDKIAGIPFLCFNVHLPSAGDGGEKIHVDATYLNMLKKILDSGLEVKLRFLGKTVHPEVLTVLRGRNIEHVRIHTRAGNRRLRGKPLPRRKKGRIACRRKLCQNVLLPNGDVVLCCMDYGLKHVLGNLLESGYEALFKNQEFMDVRDGLRDESLDILCRTCDDFAYKVNVLSRIIEFSRSQISAIRKKGQYNQGKKECL
jgi:hypothetical protein